MPTATKVFLAIFATFIVVLVVYYSKTSDGDGAEQAMNDSVQKPAAAANDLTNDRMNDRLTTRGTDQANDRLRDAPRGSSGPATARPPADDPQLTWTNTAAQPGSSGEPATVDRLGTPRPSWMPDPARDQTRYETANDGRTSDRGGASSDVQPIRNDIPLRRAVGIDEPRVTTSNPPIPNGPLNVGTPARPTFIDYKIQSGDTMTDIAQQFLGTARRWPEIAQANPLVDPERLAIGKTLRIPVDRPSAGPPARPNPATAPAGTAAPTGMTTATTYIVQPSDTLTVIAERVYRDGRKWRQIYDANRDRLPDADTLEIGQPLRIPR